MVFVFVVVLFCYFLLFVVGPYCCCWCPVLLLVLLLVHRQCAIHCLWKVPTEPPANNAFSLPVISVVHRSTLQRFSDVTCRQKMMTWVYVSCCSY